MCLLYGGIFDLDLKEERLEEVERELEVSSVWDNPERAQALGKERVELETTVHLIHSLSQTLVDSNDLLEMAIAEQDESTFESVQTDVQRAKKTVENLEFKRMFNGPMDSAHCYVDIQSGSGGTEAQDWASMLLRMYLRWAEKQGFVCEVMDHAPGDVAGIKGATIRIEGEYAYGWLRTETGVHRLVRKSPFDSGNRRHTSFASVFVSPEIDDNIEIDVNLGDCRIDTYRASGAGGQHINKTDSAVRITHLPTNTVVQCQNERSQHKNKAQAIKLLRAKLYEMEMQKKQDENAALEASKSDIGWGSQIRSYVLDQSRIKDLRTGVESSNPSAVLDGDLNEFIEASLKMNVEKK